MFRRTFIAALLAASPALAQSPVHSPAAPDCTVDGALSDKDGLSLDITFRCRATQPLTFQPDEDRAAPYMHDLKAEQKDGVAEARYRFDLSGFARSVDSTSIAVLRGNGVLATLGSWLLEPRGYDRFPTIDIRVAAAPGLVFAAGLPKAGDAWRLSGTSVRFAGYTALGRLAYREFLGAGAGIAAQQPGQRHRRAAGRHPRRRERRRPRRAVRLGRTHGRGGVELLARLHGPPGAGRPRARHEQARRRIWPHRVGRRRHGDGRGRQRHRPSPPVRRLGAGP